MWRRLISRSEVKVRRAGPKPQSPGAAGRSRAIGLAVRPSVASRRQRRHLDGSRLHARFVLQALRPTSYGVRQAVPIPLQASRAIQRAGSYKENDLLKYAIIFAIVSLIAGALGFTGVAAGAAGIAKILFFIFLAIAVLFVILAVLGVGAARKALR